MYYGNAPSFNDVDRTGGAFDAPTAHHIHDSENVLTLDQLHHTMHGKGNGAPGAGRNHTSRLVFGSIGNTSRLVSEAQARKRGGGSGGGSGDAKLRTLPRHDSADKQRSSPTPPGVHLVSGGDSARRGIAAGAVTAGAAGAASNDGMDWDPTDDEAAAMQAAATRCRANFQQRRHPQTSSHGGSPRTPSPVVESPVDSDEATPPPRPGALTIQRMNFHRHSRMMGMDEGDLDAEMEEQHRRQHAVMHEGSMARLVLWRDPARTALVFAAGVAALAAARAPGIVAEHIPVNPVVVAAYAAMAYLCRAYFMAMAFPRRNHGLTIDAEGAAQWARAAAGCVNAVTRAHGDLLSGRGNKTVLRAFLGLYAVANLGGLLNSTWAVASVLWVAAFTAPPALEAERHAIAAASSWLSAQVGGRWTALPSNLRWGAGAAAAVGVFLASPAYTRLVLLFVVLVAFRLYRETHVQQLESLERAVKDAGRRLSRAGSDFHAMVGSPAQLFYRRRAAAANAHGASILSRGNGGGVGWN